MRSDDVIKNDSPFAKASTVARSGQQGVLEHDKLQSDRIANRRRKPIDTSDTSAQTKSPAVDRRCRRGRARGTPRPVPIFFKKPVRVSSLPAIFQLINQLSSYQGSPGF